MTEDGTVGVKKVKYTSQLPKCKWAIGGCGMITPTGYDPETEGFTGIYSDILRKANKTVIGYKDGYVYLIVGKTIAHSELLKLLKKMGLEYAISIDGGSSSCMKYNGKLLLSTTRVINNWVTVKE